MDKNNESTTEATKISTQRAAWADLNRDEFPSAAKIIDDIREDNPSNVLFMSNSLLVSGIMLALEERVINELTIPFMIAIIDRKTGELGYSLRAGGHLPLLATAFSTNDYNEVGGEIEILCKNVLAAPIDEDVLKTDHSVNIDNAINHVDTAMTADMAGMLVVWDPTNTQLVLHHTDQTDNMVRSCFNLVCSKLSDHVARVQQEALHKQLYQKIGELTAGAGPAAPAGVAAPVAKELPAVE